MEQRLWWVSAEDVKELVPEGGRNKTPPKRFRPGEKNEPNHRRDQPEKIDTPQRYCQTYQHKTAEPSNDKVPASIKNSKGFW